MFVLFQLWKFFWMSVQSFDVPGIPMVFRRIIESFRKYQYFLDFFLTFSWTLHTTSSQSQRSLRNFSWQLLLPFICFFDSCASSCLDLNVSRLTGQAPEKTWTQPFSIWILRIRYCRRCCKRWKRYFIKVEKYLAKQPSVLELSFLLQGLFSDAERHAYGPPLVTRVVKKIPWINRDKHRKLVNFQGQFFQYMLSTCFSIYICSGNQKLRSTQTNLHLYNEISRFRWSCKISATVLIRFLEVIRKNFLEEILGC